MESAIVRKCPNREFHFLLGFHFTFSFNLKKYRIILGALVAKCTIIPSRASKQLVGFVFVFYYFVLFVLFLFFCFLLSEHIKLTDWQKCFITDRLSDIIRWHYLRCNKNKLIRKVIFSQLSKVKWNCYFYHHSVSIFMCMIIIVTKKIKSVNLFEISISPLIGHWILI